MGMRAVVRADGLMARLDRGLGGAIESATVNHHRRRLRRLGWAGALDPPPGDWASGDPPPRAGNAAEVLVDGAAVLPRIAAAIESAESHVHLSGWHFSPDFALRRDGSPLVLRNLLADAAERVDVRMLAWAGAPLPLFRPSRRDVRAVRDALCHDTNVRMALDARERPLHCHHEKLVIVDDRLAFVGGIDLSLLAGDRFDSSDHPARAAVGWHDGAALVRGPIVADVADHFRLRWREVTGETLPHPVATPPAGNQEVQLVRTVPERIYSSLPRGEFRILESYVRAFRSAQRLVYLENQFLWAPEVVDVLVEKVRRPPTSDFRLLVVLPSRPNNGQEDTRGQLAQLAEADDGAGRFLACTIWARRGPIADRIYVHAKVGIVDDRWLTIGSANLNEHSLFNDTEVNLVVRDGALARDTRLRLWAEHLERPVESVAGDPTEVIDTAWRPVAEEQLQRLQRGEPLEHRLARLPAVSRRTSRLRGPLDSLLVDS